MANPSSSTDRPDLRPPLCAAAPVLWVLLPLIGGILAARPGQAWMAGAVLLAGGIVIAATHSGRLLAIAGGLVCGLALGTLNSERPHPSWPDRPPREVAAELRIEELFNARKPGRMAGVAALRRAGLPVDTVTGHRVAFYLDTGPLAERPPALGEVLACRGVLTYLPAVEEPDDYQTYLLGRNIFLTFNSGEVLRELVPAPPLERLRQRLYGASVELLTAGCREPSDPGNVLASMLLGDRSLLTDGRIALYRRTGTYHLFAVSGLHVGSVSLCLLLTASFLRIPRIPRLLVLLAGTWGYVWLTGSSPSAVRAGIMISTISVSRVLLRQPHLVPALALSALLVLAWQPAQLFHLGFQLSYCVVAAIILIGLPASARIREIAARRHADSSRNSPGRRLAGKAFLGAGDLICVSLSASLASMPLIVQHFNLFTPGGVLFGILLNPLATLSVMTGAAALMAGTVLGPSLAGTLAVLLWPVIRLMEWLLHTCLSIPGAVSERSWAWPAAGTCLVLTALLAAWWLQLLRMRGTRLHFAFVCLPWIIVLAGLSMTTVDT